MPLLVSKTYEIVTPESAEDGEVAESGFDFENEPFTFRELVQTMRVHYQPSMSHISMDNDPQHVWFTSGADTDYLDGSETTTSIHFSRDNLPRMRKYWLKAAKFAGIIR